MYAIYATATSTLVWLGEATDELLIGTFELLKLYSKLTETDRRMWQTELTTDEKIGTVSMMNRIFKLEYWKRIWVVQEILFSDKVFLIYGQNALAYDEFFACTREICSVLANFLDLEALPPGSLFPEAFSLVALAQSINLMISEFIPACGAARHGKYLSLREWRTAQLKRSMDRRDKVFGYYGCFHPSIQKQIQVDYSKTLPEVMTLMMRLLLQEEGLNMLFGPRMSYDPMYEIPSWVWSLMEPATVSSRDIGVISNILDKDPGDWCAGGTLSSVIDFSEDGRMLHVRGKLVATIEATAPPFSSPPRSTGDDLFFLDRTLTDLDFKVLIEHFRLAWQSFNLLPEFPSTLGFISAFWLGPSSPILSELASWLGTDGSGSLEASQAEYTPHLVDSLMSIHFRRRMFYFMPATLNPSPDPIVRQIQGHIHGESGIGPEDVEPGDKLCVLRGCPVPVVLRQVQDQYIILGEAHAPLLMHGEAVQAAGEREYEDFWIR